MRGTLYAALSADPLIRITPAHAGNTAEESSSAMTTRDHPRTCGEHVTVLCLFKCSSGSPPHMRGTLKMVRPSDIMRGITPAHAGNTRVYPPRVRRPRDHPRTCGEHADAELGAFALMGSPPHMRGTLKDEPTKLMQLRITPAHAGNTPCLRCLHIA